MREKAMGAGQAVSEERLGYSIAEVAQQIGVCSRTIINAIQAGELKAVRIGRRVIISRQNAEKFLTRDRLQRRKKA
jgi:excisionase family DNA binding protein